MAKIKTGTGSPRGFKNSLQLLQGGKAGATMPRASQKKKKPGYQATMTVAPKPRNTRRRSTGSL